jgi:hypothetical protein
VGHSVSRAEVWHLKKTLLESPNGASMSAGQLCGKMMIKCEKYLKNIVVLCLQVVLFCVSTNLTVLFGIACV